MHITSTTESMHQKNQFCRNTAAIIRLSRKTGYTLWFTRMTPRRLLFPAAAFAPFQASDNDSDNDSLSLTHAHRRSRTARYRRANARRAALAGSSSVCDSVCLMPEPTASAVFSVPLAAETSEEWSSSAENGHTMSNAEKTISPRREAGEEVDVEYADGCAMRRSEWINSDSAGESFQPRDASSVLTQW